MNRLIINWLLKFYPAQWRAEYGAEMEDILGRKNLTMRAVADVLWSALRERTRKPAGIFVVLSLLVTGGVFVASVLFSANLWRLVSAPAVQALRDRGISPPFLIATSPLESAVVVWLGVPLLFTAVVAYPSLLLIACRTFARRRRDRFFAIGSATLFAASFVATFEVVPVLVRLSPATSLSDFFVQLTASTLGVSLVLQMPVAMLYWRRSRI